MAKIELDAGGYSKSIFGRQSSVQSILLDSSTRHTKPDEDDELPEEDKLHLPNDEEDDELSGDDDLSENDDLSEEDQSQLQRNAQCS